MNNSATLVFSHVTSSDYVNKETGKVEVGYQVAIVNAQFNGAIQASTYFSKPPAEFFAELAENWRGWVGEKKWGDLESNVILKAKSSSLGNVFIEAELRGGPIFENSLIVNFELESGQLDNYAKQLQHLFNAGRQ